MATPKITDLIVPGSIRTIRHEWTTTLIDVQCGRCGHQQETWHTAKTSTCKSCGRTMRLDTAARDGNVTPIRRTS
jgi:ribosomal protein S27E